MFTSCKQLQIWLTILTILDKQGTQENMILKTILNLDITSSPHKLSGVRVKIVCLMKAKQQVAVALLKHCHW